MKIVLRYPREQGEGLVEYKSILEVRNKERLDRLASQMKYRLTEGGGEAIYYLGIYDNGLLRGLSEEEEKKSLMVLEKVASILGARIKVIERKRVGRGNVVKVLVRLNREDSPPVQVIISALGNVDAGKSTLIGVLCTGELDDGRGSGMRKIARFMHEIETGRTSSVAVRLLGFGMDDKPTNWDLPNPLDEAQIYLSSNKVIYFVDLGGHERYLRTTLRGVMAKMPDYVMLVVSANNGLLVMGREHLGISAALKIPVFIVVTKIDIVGKPVLDATLEEISETLRKIGKKPKVVRNHSDVSWAASFISSGRVVPIFLVSNVTGEGLGLVNSFLNILPPRKRWRDKLNQSLLMYIDDKFNVKGVGTVVAGFIQGGIVSENDTVYIGPFEDGSWKKVRVKSIHINRLPVSKARAGEEATLALAGIDYNDVEKGMVVLKEKQKPVREFLAKITILRHPTTIKRGYETVFHLYSIRSTVKFVEMEKEPMRTGDSGLVRLCFSYHPWFFKKGERFILRDSRTRAIGSVVEILG